MSIFKDRQQDNSRTFWTWIQGFFLSKICPSYLAEYRGSRRECKGKMGHEGKHYDGTSLKWGYGDNWLEMSS